MLTCLFGLPPAFYAIGDEGKLDMFALICKFMTVFVACMNISLRNVDNISLILCCVDL